MRSKYPLMDNDENLQAASGRQVSEINLDRLDDLTGADLQVSAETLYAQAEIAREAGYTQLAANLTRAAELTAVPNEELLQMYEMLRPGRSSYERLEALAAHLEAQYNAAETARLVREAAQAYQKRGLLRR